MTWVVVPEEDKIAYKAAQERGRVRTEQLKELQKDDMDAYLSEMDKLWAEIDKAHTYYFRLNIWGMGTARDVMAAAGMLCDPEPPSSEDWKSVPEWDDDEDDGGPAYRQAHDKVAAMHNGECPGIPVHKFCSNDGWIVTPAEIHAALRRKNMDAVALMGIEVPVWWGEWCQWMLDAADHEGFRVY